MGASGLSQAGDARKQRPFLWHALSRPRHLCEPAPFVLCPLSLALLLGATDSDMQEAGCEVWVQNLHSQACWPGVTGGRETWACCAAATGRS